MKVYIKASYWKPGESVDAEPILKKGLYSTYRPGMRKRKREVVFSARARATMWGNVIAPGIVDRRAARAIRTGR